MKINVSDIFTQCLIRDKHTCQDCGSLNNIEIHHILPISQGGRNDLNNLKSVCFHCHRTNYKDIHYPKDKSKLIPYEEREKIRYGMDKSKKTQVNISYTKELKEEIEDYQFKSRIPSRTAAIIELIEKGLNSTNEKEPAE